MGLFSRRATGGQSAAQGRGQRTQLSSEAQAAGLRAKARRRLAGAVAMVLAAIVVLPMVLDSEPVPLAEDIPVSIPDLIARPMAQPHVASAPAPFDGEGGTTAAPATTPVTPEAPPAAPEAPLNLPPVTTPPARPATPAQPTPATPRPAPTPERPATPTPPPAAPAAPAREPQRSNDRSDDGAVALALLEGRNVAAAPARPAAPAAQQQGRFVLQVAAYTTEADASNRRNALHAAGVTNAFVEPVTANGKRQFRLRVGPFPSRDAAQAAQARLRTLGYDNGFIAPQ